MKVLIACEYSGVIREAFKNRGHDVLSCDLLDTEVPGNHYKGDIRDVLYDNWDLIIAHPPCTFITNSGVHLLYKDETRWISLKKACDFFRLFIDHPCEKICIENPIPHKYAIDLIGKKYDQLIQPFMFGHTERKATCLWLKGLPVLKETNNVKEEMIKLPKSQQQRLFYLPKSKDRAKLRSKTYKGIADAMSQQWG